MRRWIWKSAAKKNVKRRARTNHLGVELLIPKMFSPIRLPPWRFQSILSTEDSRPSGSFFTQVDHLFLANSFSKPGINPADFCTLKISEPSDHWLKSYANKLTFSQQKVNFLAITFEPVVRLSPNFESEKICMIHGLFAKAVCRKQVIHLGEKRSTWARMSCTR